MSKEVNLSEESNNPENESNNPGNESLDQKELLEDVVEIRQMIHQQRFAECNPMLFAIIKNCPNHQPYIQRLVQGLLSTVIASLSLFQRKKMSTETLGFLKLDAKAIKEFKIPETTPETRATLVSEAISELDQFLVDIVEQSEFTHIENGGGRERNGTHQQLGGQGINCRRKDGIFDNSTFLIIPISRRDKSVEDLFAILFPLLIQTG